MATLLTSLLPCLTAIIAYQRAVQHVQAQAKSLLIDVTSRCNSSIDRMCALFVRIIILILCGIMLLAFRLG